VDVSPAAVVAVCCCCWGIETAGLGLPVAGEEGGELLVILDRVEVNRNGDEEKEEWFPAARRVGLEMMGEEEEE